MQTFYTVRVRRFLLIRRFRVTKHSWENGRLILNLVNNTQIQFPQNRILSLKIFSDFWDYRRDQETAMVAQKEAAEMRMLKEADMAELQRLRAMTAKAGGELQGVPATMRQQPIVNTPQHVQELSEEEEAMQAHPGIAPEIMRTALDRVRGVLPEGPMGP